MDSWVRLVSAVAWPLTALVIVTAFRKEMQLAINRLVAIGKEGVQFQPSPQEQSDRDDGKPGLGNIRQDLTGSAASSPIKDGIADLMSSNPPAFHAFIDDLAKAIRAAMPAEREQQVQWLLKEAIDSTGALHLERIYAIIWGSQIQSLEHIIASGGRVPIASLRPFYDAARQQFTDLYKNYSFDQWLGYLLAPSGPNGPLIKKISDDVVELAPAGQAFIPYVRRRGYTLIRAG